MIFQFTNWYKRIRTRFGCSWFVQRFSRFSYWYCVDGLCLIWGQTSRGFISFMVCSELTSSKTPPNKTALLPGVATSEKPHLCDGRAPDCFTAIHFHFSSAALSPSFNFLLFSTGKYEATCYSVFHHQNLISLMIMISKE